MIKFSKINIVLVFFSFAQCIKALDNILFINGMLFPLINVSFISACLFSDFIKVSLNLSYVISIFSLNSKFVFNSALKELMLKFL